MARIAPFRAYRFNPSVVGDLTAIVTQPYDKIGPKLQDEYYARSPYNIARIIKSKEQIANSSTDYPEAGKLFRQWLLDGILRPDPEPGLYPYYQSFKAGGREFTRKGFVALVALEEGQKRHALIADLSRALLSEFLNLLLKAGEGPRSNSLGAADSQEPEGSLQFLPVGQE